MKKGINVLPIENPDKNVSEPQTKQQTDKGTLKRIEKQIRKLDGIITDLHYLHRSLDELAGEADFNQRQYTEKDADRIREMAAIVGNTLETLWYMNRRMARKYVGKNVDGIDASERKTLK